MTFTMPTQIRFSYSTQSPLQQQLQLEFNINLTVEVSGNNMVGIAQQDWNFTPTILMIKKKTEILYHKLQNSKLPILVVKEWLRQPAPVGFKLKTACNRSRQII